MSININNYTMKKIHDDLHSFSSLFKYILFCSLVIYFKLTKTSASLYFLSFWLWNTTKGIDYFTSFCSNEWRLSNPTHEMISIEDSRRGRAF